jgi:hypothetical protein
MPPLKGPQAKEMTYQELGDALASAGFARDPLVTMFDKYRAKASFQLRSDRGGHHITPVGIDPFDPVPPAGDPPPVIPRVKAGTTNICLKLPPWGPDDLLLMVDGEAMTPPAGTEINLAAVPGPTTEVVVVKHFRLEHNLNDLLDSYVVVAPKK